jgi:hypothetical protein
MRTSSSASAPATSSNPPAQPPPAVGLYNLERDTLTGRFVWRKNWRTFLEFLKWDRGQYPLRRWLRVVLVNVGYHRKAEIVSAQPTPSTRREGMRAKCGA